MTDTFILKLASGGVTSTYSPMMAASRNYIPAKPSINPGLVKINGAQEIKPKPSKFEGSEVPRSSGNITTHPDNTDVFRRPRNTFDETISGTGYGRRYWSGEEARNAYSLA